MPAPAKRAGMAARQLALDVLDAVIDRRQALDDVLEVVATKPAAGALAPRDRSFVIALVMSVLRHYRSLSAVLAPMLQRPLPDDAARVHHVLRLGAAQLLVLETPAHAAIDLAVDQVRLQRKGARYSGLVNAVLRRVLREGRAAWEALDRPRLETPDWLWSSWSTSYGAETAAAIAIAHQAQPSLDLTLRDPTTAPRWAKQLSGTVLANGSVRLSESHAIEQLPGYAEGAWWVQDAAASLPVQLFGAVRGRTVADLCAAPGGKTLQLAAAGAIVTAVDASRPRLARLSANLNRIGVSAEIIHADVETWQPDRRFDAVLLDAPCSATGTLRRHPDIALTRTADDVVRQAARQSKLLDAAARLVAKNGLLVACVCSLEAAEGEDQVAPFLARHSDFRLDPITQSEVVAGPWITPGGWLRTLPCHAPGPATTGMDGFFAARFRRHLSAC